MSYEPLDISPTHTEFEVVEPQGDPEAHYVVKLEVQVPGYGRRRDQERTAYEVARALNVQIGPCTVLFEGQPVSYDNQGVER